MLFGSTINSELSTHPPSVAPLESQSIAQMIDLRRGVDGDVLAASSVSDSPIPGDLKRRLRSYTGDDLREGGSPDATSLGHPASPGLPAAAPINPSVVW